MAPLQSAPWTSAPNATRQLRQIAPSILARPAQRVAVLAQSADAIDLVNVARVANLAEAGFICDELIGLGMEAQIHQLEDFDAASHRSYRSI